jgi:energy-coupling factor transporter ATP-binding protein EcfA2
VMTTHETDDILDLADRVIVLEKGRAVLNGTPTEVFSQPERIRAAGVKIPDALDIWTQVHQLAGLPVELTSEQIARLDAEYVGQRVDSLVGQGELKILPPASIPSAPSPSGNPGDAGPPPVLIAEDLTYAYPGYPPVVALKDVNLSIRQGEIVGVVGQNGSGKSTLVKSFVGLLRPTKGRVLVNGRDLRGRPVGEMAREVGLVLQNPDYQLFTASSREEILFGLQNIGIEGPEAEEKVKAVLQWVGLEHEFDTFPFRLSFGDRRKLAVAATIALGPQVLILDEPTTAQDHRGRYQLAEIGRRLRDEDGRTIVMITHDMDLIARYAERLVVMWNGQIILDGSTGEVFSQTETLARTFLRPPAAAQVASRLQGAGAAGDIVTIEQLLAVLGQEG